MIEVLYRIYKVLTDEEKSKYLELAGDYAIIHNPNSEEIYMDCIICDDRDHFKSIIRDRYGDNIPFRYSKKLNPGDLYCVIIGEHCWDTNKYFDKKSFECDLCGTHVETYYSNPIMIAPYVIKNELYCRTDDYEDKKFCSKRCLNTYVEREHKRLKPNDEDEFWVNREMFLNNGIKGYVYKITKRSTGEFYVGQSRYVPMFRWCQHLKTERFPQDKIDDYIYEILEIVTMDKDLLEREKYHIQENYKKCPEKSLNISQTKNIDYSYSLWEATNEIQSDK